MKFHDSNLHRRAHLAGWKSGSMVSYPLSVEKPGTYKVEIDVVCNTAAKEALNKWTLQCGDSKNSLEIGFTSKKREGWKTISADELTLEAG